MKLDQSIQLIVPCNAINYYEGQLKKQGMTLPSKFILRTWRTSGIHKICHFFVFSFELLADFLMSITNVKSWASLKNQSQATSDPDLAVTKGGVQKPISSCYFQLCKLTVLFLLSPFPHSTPPLFSFFFSFLPFLDRKTANNEMCKWHGSFHT